MSKVWYSHTPSPLARTTDQHGSILSSLHCTPTAELLQLAARKRTDGSTVLRVAINDHAVEVIHREASTGNGVVDDQAALGVPGQDDLGAGARLDGFLGERSHGRSAFGTERGVALLVVSTVFASPWM